MTTNPESPAPSNESLAAALPAVERRLRRLTWAVLGLTAAVMLMTLVLALTVAAVFGELVNWFGRDPLLFGGVSIGAAVLAFVLGFLSGLSIRRRAQSL